MEEIEQIKNTLEKAAPAIDDVENQIEGESSEAEAIILLIMEYGRQIFGEKDWADIVSGQFDFKLYKQKIVNAEKMKLYLEVLRTSTSEQFKNLASVSALCSTLLVIATFNDRIFSYTIEVKYLLTLLLSAIIVSIWGFYKNFGDAQDQSFNELLVLTEQSGGKEEAEKLKKMKKDSKKKLLGYIPFLVNALITFVILGIISLIWK